MRRNNPFIVLTGFFLMTGTAMAFEQHGFKSGMTLEEAKASTQVPLGGRFGGFQVANDEVIQATKNGSNCFVGRSSFC